MESTIDHQGNDITTRVAEIKALNKAGRYFDAYQLGLEYFGPIEQWHSKEQLLELIICLDRIGLSRQSDALRIRLYRRFPNDSEVALRVAYLFLYSKGPAFVWELTQTQLQRTDLTAEIRAEWLSFKALICSSLRDFEQARVEYEEAQALFVDNWIKRVEGYILVDQEQFAASADYLAKLYQEQPSEALLLQYVKALGLAEREDDALVLIEQEAERFQSVRPYMYLAQLYKERNQTEKLQQALIKIKRWCVGQDKAIKPQISYFEANVALAQGEFIKARELFLENKTRYCEIIAENLDKNNGDKVVKLEVPFVKQKYLTCAPASIAAVLNYFSLNVTQEAIAHEICYDGTPDYLQHQWLDAQNIPFIEFDLDWSLAKQLIDLGLPFTLVTRSGRESHMQVVTGYHERAGILYIMDPSSVGISDMLAELAIEVHKSVGPRCMLMLPGEHIHQVANLTFPNQQNYAHYREFSSAIRGNNLAQAQVQLELMKTEFPGERLTLLADRNLAIESKNEFAIEATTSKLLDLFPEEVWLITSRFYSLCRIGRRSEAVEFLFEKYRESGQHELLESLVLDIYEDPKYAKECHKMARRLHKLALYYAESNWILGHLYWHWGEHELARRHYRWSVTLNDRDERYSESFFKSCIWNGTQEQALEFLIKRWKNYSAKSSGPSISLFQAYAAMDREHDGLDILKESLRLRPQDRELLHFALRKFLLFGELDLFTEYLQSATEILSERERLAIEAEYHYIQDNHQKTAQLYESLIQAFPLDREYYDRLFRILAAQGEQSVIDSKLDALYESYGFLPLTAWLVIDWHSNSAQKESNLERLIAEVPGDLTAVERYARLLMNDGRSEQAKKILLASCNAHSQSASLYSLLAMIALDHNDITNAQEYAWQAIELNQDSDQAFEALNATHWTIEARKLMLQRLNKLVQQNVSTGDLLWNYWHVARAWLSREQLVEFCQYLKQHYAHLWYAYVLMAKQYIDDNEPEKAIKELTLAQQKFPLLPRVHLDLAETYYLLNMPEKAIEAFNQVLVLNPSWSTAARRLADVYEKLGENDKSLEVLEKSCRYNSDDGILYGLRADLLMQQERNTEALALLVQAVTKEPQYSWGWRTLSQLAQELGQEHLALDTARKLVQEQPKNGDVWIAYANLQANAQDAENILHQGIVQVPSSLALRRELIELYIAQKQFEQARAQVEDEYWGDNAPASIRIMSAIIFAEQGRYGEAIEYLAALIDQHPNFYDGWQRLHQWYLNFNMFDKAVAAAKSMVELAPHSANTLSVCAETLFQHGSEEDRGTAATWLEKAFNLDASDNHVALSWLDYLLDVKRYQDAIEAEAIIHRFMDHALVDIRILRRLSESNEIQSLEKLIAQILAKNEDNTWIYFEMYRLTADHNKADWVHQQLFNQLERDDCCAAIAIVWAYQEVQGSGPQQLLSFLDARQRDAVWYEVATQYFRFLEKNQKLPQKDFMSKHREAVKEHDELFPIYGFLLCLREDFAAAKQWYDSRDLYQLGLGYVWYHKRWAQIMQGDWQGARESIVAAISCQPDNCFSNICLWFAFIKAISNESLTREDLINISQEELTGVEKYLYQLVMTIYRLGDAPVELSNRELWSNLARAKIKADGFRNSFIVVQCRYQVAEYLRARRQASNWFEKLRLNRRLKKLL